MHTVSINSGAKSPVRVYEGMVMVLLLSIPATSHAQLSDASQECIDCHISYSPGIVADWESSRHSISTPEAALTLPEIERRISAESVPDNLSGVVVGCYECHSLNADRHPDNFEHFGYRINMIPSPGDCRVCHPTEVSEYEHSKKAYAFDILDSNTLFHTLVNTSTALAEVNPSAPAGSHLMMLRTSSNITRETCYGCHGTRVEVTGHRTIQSDFGDFDVPVLSNWPNVGVGRINPDGSRGACTACHPRHSFSIEIARRPHTCSQCHLEPDVPAWEVYRESKHGNIYNSIGDRWNWDAVPWTVGTDFTAPTCAACHNSMLVSPDGELIAERTHDFGARLWVRIFGLPYSHPQPKTGRTFEIRNSDGQPLPTTFAGDLASEYLIDSVEQNTRRGTMGRVCRSCHGPTWVDAHFAKLDTTIAETDRMVAAATGLVQVAWKEGYADPSNPFDEPIENKWVRQWLFYANSVRYASAMSGPDYATFKNGWFQMTANLKEMEHQLELQRALDR